MKKKWTRLRWATMAAFMALVLLAVGMAAPDLLAVEVPAAEVVGGDPYWLACLGCTVGGLGIILGGPSTILTALFVSKGAYIVAGCVYSCGQLL